MKMTVTGTIRGQPVSLTYSRGLVGKPKLEGDILAVDEVLLAAEVRKGEAVGPVGGPYVTENYLNDPLAALFLMLEVFDEGSLQATGDVPEAPGAPEGAII